MQELLPPVSSALNPAAPSTNILSSQDGLPPDKTPQIIALDSSVGVEYSAISVVVILGGKQYRFWVPV